MIFNIFFLLYIIVIYMNHNGGNFFGNFRSTSNQTLNSLQNNSVYKFDEAFKKSDTLIEKTDFNNSGGTLHDNLSNNLKGEYLNEYQINVDSNDRNRISYPNPFSFILTFGGTTRDTLTNKYGTDPITYEGTANPIILRQFKNVKYINFNYILLPMISTIFKKNKNEDCLMDFADYPYIVMRVDELTTSRTLSTNSIINGNGFVFYPEQYVGGDYLMWVAFKGQNTYQTSLLMNLTQMTISFYTPDGKKFVYDDIYNLRCFISMTLGVFETELNTTIKYYK